MTDDHHGRTAGRATLLVRAVDEILGTHDIVKAGAVGQDGGAVEVTELVPTPLVLPTSGDLVRIPTQRWALEQWNGDDQPELAAPWHRKPKYSVDGNRSCAELAIVHRLRQSGWNGVRVNAFRGEPRPQWFPPRQERHLRRSGRSPEWSAS